MELFKQGSTWLRADFHLHTRADKEAFKGWDETVSFPTEYIKRLQEENIRVGVITNHNKFDRDEYKALARAARKEEIFLLPGVELSIGEGNGIHTLIIFEPDAWLSQHEDFINRLLDEAYSHLSRQNRENQNARTQWNLKLAFEKLDEHKANHRDAFMIMAHVNQDNGFCCELKDGRQEEFIHQPLFRKFVLGFQKCTSVKTKENLSKWYGSSPPAFVEGCDNKDLADVGKTRQENGQLQKFYLKIGDFSYFAVKYALMDSSRNTIAAEAPQPRHAFIESITFQTASEAPLANITLDFNSNMNNLIGIRGSGKSTILEAVRYVLDKKIDVSSRDTDYKQRLVEHTLRSGGKAILKMRDRHHHNYRIERVYLERPAIYRDDVRLPEFSVDETLINVLYFGQKDLSEVGTAGFSQALMEKFFGAQVTPIRDQIEQKRKQIIEMLDQLKKLDEIIERKAELLEEKAALNERLRIFKEKKVDEKLKRQVQFNQDRIQLKQMIEAVENFQNELREIYSNRADVFKKFAAYHSSVNTEMFESVQKIWENIQTKLYQINTTTTNLDKDLSSLKQALTNIDAQIDHLRDEFAEIKRTINLPEINPDDYINFNKRLNLLEAKLSEIDKSETKYKNIKNAFCESLRDLNDLWHNEYQTLQNAIDALNAKGLSITVDLNYKGDKKTFKDYVSSILKGSGVTNKNLESLVNSYNDCIEIYLDLKETKEKLKEILSSGNQYQKFSEYFQDNLRSLLTYQVPNQYILKYKGKNISNHSLGQRASALIVFLLARKENDLIIIDQPEDDIDNQSIYEDVIRELNHLKDQTQFLFATHNPNIPVLGECEQVFCCRYANEKINLEIGSIDRPAIQNSIIEIMEGGHQAFEQRQRKYNEWKH